MNNLKIRNYAKKNGIKLYELAEKFGVADFNFSRMLRKEFSEEDTKKALEFIDEIVAERRI